MAIQSRIYDNTNRLGTYEERAINTDVMKTINRLECLLHWICRRSYQPKITGRVRDFNMTKENKENTMLLPQQSTREAIVPLFWARDSLALRNLSLGSREWYSILGKALAHFGCIAV